MWMPDPVPWPLKPKRFSKKTFSRSPNRFQDLTLMHDSVETVYNICLFPFCMAIKVVFFFLVLCFFEAVVSRKCSVHEDCNVPACLIGTSQQYYCEESFGYQCVFLSNVGQLSLCPCLASAGSYCISDTAITTDCPANSYCTGQRAIAACPNGMISPANSPSLASCYSPCSEPSQHAFQQHSERGVR